MGQPRTMYQVLRETARRFPHAPALRQPKVGDGPRDYVTYSWTDYLRAVEEIAAGLYSIGVARGEIVVLDSETRLEFYLSDFGVMACGAAAAAVAGCSAEAC